MLPSRPPLTEVEKAQHAQIMPGFESISPTKLLRAKDRRPIFVDVSTEWCGPCNEAKEFLFPNPEFQKAVADWRKIYVDDEDALAREWRSVFVAHTIPAFVLINPELKVVGRYDGPIQLKRIKDWIQEARKFYPTPVAEIQRRVLLRKQGSWLQRAKDFLSHADRDAEKSWALRWAISSEDDQFLKQFSDSDVPESLIIAWFRRSLGTEKRKEVRRAKLERILASEKGHEEFSHDLDRLCNEDRVGCLPWVKQLPDHVGLLEKSPFRSDEERHTALAEEFYFQTYVFKTLADEAKIKDAADRCLSESELLEKTSPLPLSRTGALQRKECLSSSGQDERLEPLIKKLMAAYPNDSTFMSFWGTHLWRKKHQPKAAYRVLSKARKIAYGYEWVTISQRMAKIELELGRYEHAAQTARDAIARLDLTSADSADRDQMYAIRLREIETEALSHLSPTK